MSSCYTFDIVYDGDNGPIRNTLTVEAEDAFSAWRRIGGQLVNGNEANSLLPISIKLRDDADTSGPVLGKSGRRAKLK
jgi:hypothetical protein